MFKQYVIKGGERNCISVFRSLSLLQQLTWFAPGISLFGKFVHCSTCLRCFASNLFLKQSNFIALNLQIQKPAYPLIGLVIEHLPIKKTRVCDYNVIIHWIQYFLETNNLNGQPFVLSGNKKSFNNVKNQ